MIKFDPASVSAILRITAAEARHPKPEELPTVRFPSWNQPAVTFTGQRATAVGYTKSYGLLAWTGGDREEHMEWVAAGLIKRVVQDS